MNIYRQLLHKLAETEGYMMKRMRLARIVGFMLVLTIATYAANTSTANAEESPLQPFERLVGGQWHIEGTYVVWEWGMEKLSLFARSYVPSEDGDKMVSEGFMFWHPGEQKVRGYATGIGAGVDLWDYTMNFHGDTIKCDLVTYGQYSGDYHETWTFTGEDEYVWTLFQKTEEGHKEMMSNVFKRKK